MCCLLFFGTNRNGLIYTANSETIQPINADLSIDLRQSFHNKSTEQGMKSYNECSNVNVQQYLLMQRILFEKELSVFPTFQK